MKKRGENPYVVPQFVRALFPKGAQVSIKGERGLPPHPK